MNQLMDIDKVTESNLLMKEIEKSQATKKKFALWKNEIRRFNSNFEGSKLYLWMYDYFIILIRCKKNDPAISVVLHKLAKKDIEKLGACGLKALWMQEALVTWSENFLILVLRHNQIMHSTFCLF